MGDHERTAHQPREDARDELDVDRLDAAPPPAPAVPALSVPPSAMQRIPAPVAEATPDSVSSNATASAAATPSSSSALR